MFKKKILIVIFCIFAIISCFAIYSFMNPKITKENVVSVFNENRQHFITIKDYLLTKEDNYYVDFDTYNDEIEDENVKISIRYLFNKLGYGRIYKYDDQQDHYIIFLRGGNDNDEFGVIFTINGTCEYGTANHLIYDNWYFYWVGFV